MDATAVSLYLSRREVQVGLLETPGHRCLDARDQKRNGERTRRRCGSNNHFIKKEEVREEVYDIVGPGRKYDIGTPGQQGESSRPRWTLVNEPEIVCFPSAKRPDLMQRLMWI